MGEFRAYTLDPAARKVVLEQLTTELASEPDVLFAYLYGSFLDGEQFHDVDVGVYLGDVEPEKAALTAVELARRLTLRCGLPVDIRVVNVAPLAFRYHVLRGQLILNRDDARLTEFLEDTARRYLDIAPLLRQGAKEAFAA